MPAIVVLVVAAIAGSAITVAMVINAIVTLILIVGGAIYANQQRQKLKALAQGALDPGRQVMSRDGTASRTIVYGTQKVSGPMAFMQTTGTSNEYLHIVVLLAGHEIDSFVNVYFDGNALTLDGSGNVTTSQYAGFARVKQHLGTASQAADSDLVSDTAGFWSNAHTLSGIAYVYVRLKYSTDVFPNGIPNISAVIKGKKVYDPRDGTQSSTNSATWKFSSNSALCLANYLNDAQVGLNVPYSSIDTTELTAAANLCDESVTVISGTEPRFTTNVIIDTASTPEDNINVLRWAMVGSVIYSGGLFFIQGGCYRTPTLTFNESHIVGPVTVSPRLSRKDLANAVSGLRVAPEQDYTAVNFQPYIPYTWLTVSGINTTTDVLTVTGHGLSNGTPVLVFSTGTFPAPFVNLITYYVISATTNTLQLSTSVGGSVVNITSTGSGTISLLYEPYLIQDNGERIWLDLQLPATSTDSMAQRIAKINLEMIRQQITVTTTFNLSAMQFRAGDNIMLSLTRFGWSSKVFSVVDWQLSVSDSSSTPVPQVNVTLRETASGVFDWNSGEEQAYDLAPDTNLPSAFNPAAPTSLVLTAGSSTALTQPDGTLVPRMKVAWTAPADQSVLSGGHIRIEYKNSLDTNYTQWIPVPGDQTFAFISDVQIAQHYDVRIKSENTLGATSSYLSQTNFLVLGDTTAPTAPTGLTAGAGTGAIVQLKWNQNSETDFDVYSIYRNTVNTFGTATRIAYNGANAYVDASVSTSTAYFYWVTALDRSGNESSASSSASVTTGGAPAIAPGAPANPTAATFSSSASYISGDGTALAKVVMTVPALPSGAVLQNILYRVNTSASWQVAGQLNNSSSATFQVDDLIAGASYHIATVALNSDGGMSSIIEATSSPYTMPSDTTAPATPTSVTATAGLGKSITVSCSPNTESDFQEYLIYRNTTNSSGTATLIARQRNNVFVDEPLSLATTYYYWFKAADRTTNASGFSSVANATTVAVQDASVDQTAPSAPTAATLSSSGVVTASDGSIASYLDISMPALPSGAKVQNLLYRIHGTSTWLIASQQANASTQVARIDGLSPNSSYDVATQAFSFSAVPSSVTTATSSPFTAPTKSTGPGIINSPSLIGPSSAGSTLPPVNIGAAIAYAAQATWLPPSDVDVAYYNVKATLTDSDSATDYTWNGGPTKELHWNFYSSSIFIGFVRVQAVNTSGVGGTWTRFGNLNSICALPFGDVSLQSSSAMSSTGITVGGGSIPQQTATVPFNNAGISLTGGASTETKFLTLPSGLAYKPDFVTFTVSSNNNVIAAYDWDNVSNTATHAYINFRILSGTLPAGVIRLTGVAGTYT